MVLGILAMGEVVEGAKTFTGETGVIKGQGKFRDYCSGSHPPAGSGLCPRSKKSKLSSA